MATALVTLDRIAPQFASLDEELKSAFIGDAQDEVCRSNFESDDVYNKAVAYYAAHLIALSRRDENSRGNLTQEKEGDLSRSYGNGNAGEANSTQYLETYEKLISTRVSSFFVSNGCQN